MIALDDDGLRLVLKIAFIKGGGVTLFLAALLCVFNYEFFTSLPRQILFQLKWILVKLFFVPLNIHNIMVKNSIIIKESFLRREHVRRRDGKGKIVRVEA
jgi:hypothetical protein